MFGLLIADEHHYRISRDGALYIVRLYGYWDEERAWEFLRRFQWLIEISRSANWGVLTDLREWEGGTPKALKIVGQMESWMADNGQTAGAHVLNSGVKSKILLGLQRRQRERILFDTFLSMEIALPWLKAKVRHA